MKIAIYCTFDALESADVDRISQNVAYSNPNCSSIKSNWVAYVQRDSEPKAYEVTYCTIFIHILMR